MKLCFCDAWQYITLNCKLACELLLLFCPGGVLNLKAILSLLTIPEVFYLIILKLVVAIPVGVFHSMFALVNIDKFGLTAETNGYLLTYIGLLTAVSIE